MVLLEILPMIDLASTLADVPSVKICFLFFYAALFAVECGARPLFAGFCFCCVVAGGIHDDAPGKKQAKDDNKAPYRTQSLSRRQSAPFALSFVAPPPSPRPTGGSGRRQRRSLVQTACGMEHPLTRWPDFVFMCRRMFRCLRLRPR